MNFKAYINYINDGRIHAGVYMDDSVVYVREAERGTSNPLKGFVDLRLNEGVPRSWDSIEAVLHEAYSQIGTPHDNSIHHVEARFGTFDLLYRTGLPATAQAAIAELQHYFTRISLEGKVYEMPRSA